MPFKSIQYAMQKANVISLLILPLNKALIAETVNILHKLIERFSLTDVIKNKIVLIKKNFFTIKNITCAIYQKQNKSNTLYKFS